MLRPDEILRDGERLNVLIRLTLEGSSANYCFSFVVRDSIWAFRHLEGITLRLDKVESPPVSEFPDIDEATKIWMREEAAVTQMVYFYNRLRSELGDSAALGWFHDGAGYALAAQAWIPFLSPQRAFVLYACWEQQRLRGSDVTLIELTDSSAAILLKPLYQQLYYTSAHLKQQVSESEYFGMFEAIWHDRAKHGGWRIQFERRGEGILIRLRVENQ